MSILGAASRLLAWPSRLSHSYSGELRSSELRGTASIDRDDRGIPRISANHESDLCFAAGYAQASDRLWQMDVLRRRAHGRLSEVFGTVTTEADVLARKLAFTRVAVRSQQLLSAQQHRNLLSFSAGINAAIRRLRRRGGLPPEFLLLRYSPRPWRPIDSIAIIKHLGFDLGRNLRNEAFRAKLSHERPEHAAAFLQPKYPADGAVTVTASLPTSSQVWLEELLSGESASGSNAWAVSGTRTESGHPLLANDPHIEFTQPSLWYQLGLSLGRQTAYGVTVPGLPGLVAGGNQTLAWGITNSTIDTQDLCVLPEDTLPGQWTQASTIEVRGSDPVTVRAAGGDGYVEFTPPIPTRSGRYGLFWSGFTPSTEIEGCLRMWRTQSYPEFREALRGFGVPVLNMVVACQDGTIALKTAGNVPRRVPGSGCAPASHTEVAASWREFLSFDELPETVNPPEGYIVTANHRMLPDDASIDLGQDWGGPYRAQRIERLIHDRKPTALAFTRWQSDTMNGRAARVLPALLAALAQQPPTDPMTSACHELLGAWDLHDDGDQAAPIVFFRLMQRLTDTWVAGPLGQDLAAVMPDVTLQVDHLVLHPETRALLGDDRPLPVVVAQALTEAAELVVDDLGPDPGRWHYDDVHRIADPHPLAKTLPALFGRPSTPVGGGGQTVCLMNARPNGEVFEGAPWRFVAELTPTGTRLWDVLRHGSSGHPLSPHYDDQTDTHTGGRLYPVARFDAATR